MNISHLSDEQMFALASPIWKAMSQGSNGIDYESFSAAFSDELKILVNKERFEKQCKEFPLLTSLGEAIPVACIRRKKGVTVIFRQLSTSFEGEFVGQLTLAGTKEHHKVINAQVY